jgi:hypothetical protein
MIDVNPLINKLDYNIYNSVFDYNLQKETPELHLRTYTQNETNTISPIDIETDYVKYRLNFDKQQGIKFCTNIEVTSEDFNIDNIVDCI